MSSFGLNDFKNNFNGGTRANRFVIEGDAYGWGYFSATHIRAAAVPEVSSRAMTYDHFGRKHYYPGEKNYGTWTFTVLDDDPDFVYDSGDSMWEVFQAWQNEINNHATNYYVADGNGFGAYKTDISVKHLDINGDAVLKEFILEGAWPSNIAPISFNMAQVNKENSFNITMVYDSIRILSDDGSNQVTEKY